MRNIQQPFVNFDHVNYHIILILETVINIEERSHIPFFSISDFVLTHILVTAEKTVQIIQWSLSSDTYTVEVCLVYTGVFLDTICWFLPSISVTRWWAWHMVTTFITNAMYLSLCIFMSCPQPPMCIPSMGSFRVQSRGSLIFFSVLLGVGS